MKKTFAIIFFLFVLFLCGNLIFADEPGNINGSIQSIAFLPDTQNYTDTGSFIPNYYLLQARHITGELEDPEIEKLNIKSVVHLGDHVNYVSLIESFLSNWNKVMDARKVLSSNNMPFLPVEGNHDCNDDDTHRFFEDAFDGWLSRCRKKEWYIDHHQGTRNLALRNTINGKEYALISLEYAPDRTDISWAGRVIKRKISDDTRVILVVHDYLKTVQHEEDSDNRYKLEHTERSDDPEGFGRKVWDDLVSVNDRIDFVICGHKSGDMVRMTSRLTGESVYPDLNGVISGFIPGEHVYEVLIDYQNDDNGGNGWYKIFKFDSNTDTVRMEVHRPSDEPVLFNNDERYPDDPQLHNFTVSYP